MIKILNNKKLILLFGLVLIISTILTGCLGGNNTGTSTYYSLDVNTKGKGSVEISPEKDSYTENSSVTLTANPASDWSFGYWRGSGFEAQHNKEIEIVMDSNKNINAIFGNNIFIDDFSTDTRDNWGLFDKSKYETLNYLVDKEVLQLEKTPQENTTISLAYPKDIGISVIPDSLLLIGKFKLETGEGGYGITLGTKDLKSGFYTFGINENNNSFNFHDYHDSDGVTDSKSIDQYLNSSSYNTLAIEKDGNKFTFYLNGNLVISKELDTTIIEMMGLQGFNSSTDSNFKLRLDDIKILELNS